MDDVLQALLDELSADRDNIDISLGELAKKRVDITAKIDAINGMNTEKEQLKSQVAEIQSQLVAENPKDVQIGTKVDVSEAL